MTTIRTVTSTLTKAPVAVVPYPGLKVITGTSASDDLFGTNGDERINGFGGDDYLYGLDGNDTLDGGLGRDVMAGGRGNDTYYAESGDVVWEFAGEGVDTVIAANSFSLPANVENLVMGSTPPSGLAYYGGGNELDNLITGSAGGDHLAGGAGHDTLEGGYGQDWLHGDAGNDRLFGGLDSDRLDGGLGQDQLTGGSHGDLFLWRSTQEMGATVATADLVTDFSAAEGDLLDVTRIDADVYAAGGQAFRFIGQAAFTGVPGEINYLHSGGNTIIQFQTGMSPDVEGYIVLNGIHTPQAGWFVL